MDSAYNPVGGSGWQAPPGDCGALSGEILIVLCQQVTCISGESTNDWGYMWGLLGQ